MNGWRDGWIDRVDSVRKKVRKSSVFFIKSQKKSEEKTEKMGKDRRKKKLKKWEKIGRKILKKS